MEKKLTFELEPEQISYNSKLLERWRSGDKLDCKDEYICSMNKGTNGFGEYIVSKHFEDLGYNWIHHDFNVFGYNKLGKYPRAQEVLEKYFGKEKFMLFRQFYEHFKPLEEPDLMIYNDDCSELIFAECKRVDTKDRLRESQLRGLIFLKMLCNAKIFVYEIVPEGWEKKPENIIYKLHKQELL